MASYRRHLVGVIAIILLVGWALTSRNSFISWPSSGGGSESNAQSAMVAAGLGRVGLVMAVLWIAWPSLRRPAAWVPPGIAVGGVVLLAILAAQPRLVFVVVPAAGVLLTLGTFIKAFRKS